MATDLIGARLCGWTSCGCDLIGADDLIGTGQCDWTSSGCDLIGADDLIGAELWTPNTQRCSI
jgi:hypothetical protein